MLVTPRQFLLYTLEPQSKCECWVWAAFSWACTARSSSAVLHSHWGDQLAFSLIPAAPKGALPLREPHCHPLPSSWRAMLRDGWSPLQKPSACAEGPCFKVLSVFKGDLFHRGLSSPRFRSQTTAEGKPKALSAVQWSSQPEGNPGRVFMFVFSSCCMSVISLPLALHL